MNSKSSLHSQPTMAAPLASNEETVPAKAASSETEQRMLLFRLSDAAMRIREEADLIRRTGFTDQASRLLRILGEAVEEQHSALSVKTASAFSGETK